MINSSDDIYVSGKYFQQNPTWDVEDASWKAEVIYSILKRNNLSINEITEVGCGAGGILEHLSKLDPQIELLLGYDISPQAIQLAKQRETQKILFYNEDYTRLDANPTELLMLIDVIEHVDDFYGFLRKLRGRSRYFMFHIPLDLSCRTILKPHILLQQRNDVGHIHYYSKEMVLWFLNDTGYEIIDWQYTKPITDLNPSPTWFRGMKKILRNFSYEINKDLSAKLWGSYSMMILASKKLPT